MDVQKGYAENISIISFQINVKRSLLLFYTTWKFVRLSTVRHFSRQDVAI